MDVVSEGELRRALAAAFRPEKSPFRGLAKRRRNGFRARQGILCFNVESEPELAALSQIATHQNRVARIALRVNPDVDAKTHAKIATGKAENKFGIPLSRARDVYVARGSACLGSRSPASISISVRRSPTLPPSTPPSL